jgi:NH3-dependent NAD+ synthetase
VHAELLARGWQAHNMAAFVSGYLAHAGIEELVPGTREDVDVALVGLLAARAATVSGPPSA